MPSVWAILLVVPAVMISFFDWRKGLYAVLLVAFLQDPARKLDVDQPVYFTLLAGVVLATAYLRAQSPRFFLPTQVPGWKHYLQQPSTLLLLVLAIQAGVTMVRYGNPMIAAIGAVSYLTPLPAMLIGYHFAVRSGRIGVERWLAAYLLCALIMLPSIILEYAGVGWSTLGQVGVGFEMYTDDAILVAHSGFFRASETAAWHTATATCFLLSLSSMHQLSRRKIVIAVVTVVALLTIGVLTGRRKMFVEVVIFMSTYIGLLLYFGKGGLRLALAVLLGGAISYAALMWWAVDLPDEAAVAGVATYQQYAGRSATVADDVVDRVLGIGLAPVEWAINNFGWFGGGLGIASQGAQYFGGGSEVFGGVGEGGLGKITAELGVPGLLIALWFAVSAVRHGWAILRFVSARSAATARLACGLVAFLLANISVFFVATQVFGDMFVLIILGMTAGFFVATPVLAERERTQSLAGGRTAAQPPREGRFTHQHARVVGTQAGNGARLRR